MDIKNFLKRIKKIIFFSIFFIVILNGKSFAYDIQITDAISPFFDADKEIKHYSNIPYYQLDLDDGKVDINQMDASIIRFKEYIQRIKEKGYTHIMFDELHHLVLLEELGLYKNTDREKRNKIYRDYFKKIIDISTENGIGIYITTDMQFYDEEIARYAGELDSENRKLKEINRFALQDVFETFPEISGIIIRVGEGGGAYDDNDYKSKIIYDTPEKVNALLKEFLPEFEKYNKNLIFRTWTIGIGKIGDLIINKETYDKTFQGLISENLIISLKYTPGDYFWFDEYNPLIGYGNLKQIIEFEIRREYEGGGDFPNYIIEDYKALGEYLKDKKNIVGLWYWNQTGGWGYGKNILFNFGFPFWNEINFLNLYLDSHEKKEDVNFGNYEKELSGDEKKVLKEILLGSREVIKTGWYFDSFRAKKLMFGSIRLPPLLWIWWDRPVSSQLILSIIYQNIEDEKIEISNAENVRERTQKEFEAFKKIMNQDSELSKQILNSLENRAKIFDILALHKESIFSYFRGDSKIHKEEILRKINEYEGFKKNKEYVNFDFREVKDFYEKEDLIFERNIFLILGKLYNIHQKVDLLNIMYILILVDIMSIFILMKIKKFKFYYIFFSFSSFIIVFVCILSFYVFSAGQNLIPTYFYEAGSDMKSFIGFGQ